MVGVLHFTYTNFSGCRQRGRGFAVYHLLYILRAARAPIPKVQFTIYFTFCTRFELWTVCAALRAPFCGRNPQANEVQIETYIVRMDEYCSMSFFELLA